MTKKSKLKDLAQKLYSPTEKFYWITLSVSLIIPILIISGVIFLTILYNVPYGDDYYSIPMMSIHQIGVVDWFMSLIEKINVSSRPAQEVFAHVFYGVLGNHIPKVLPLFTILSFTGLSYLYIQKFIKYAFDCKSRVISILTASFMTLAVISFNGSLYPDGAFHMYQLFYFSAAIVTHTLPLLTSLGIIYLFFFSEYSNKLRNKFWYILFFFILSFILTSNEILAPSFGSVSLAIIIYTLLCKYILKPKKVLYSGVESLRGPILVLLSSVLAIVATIGGKASRLSEARGSEADNSLFDYAKSSYEGSTWLINNIFFQLSDILFIMLFMLVVIMITIRYGSKRFNRTKSYINVLFIGVLSLVVSFGLVFLYSLLQNIAFGNINYNIPRAMLIPQIAYILSLFLIIGGLVGLALTSGRCRYHKYIVMLIGSVILFLFVINVSTLINHSRHQLEASIDNSRRWEERDNIIKNTPKTKNSIYINNYVDGVSDIFYIYCSDNLKFENSEWYRHAIDAYYGKNICSTEDSTK